MNTTTLLIAAIAAGGAIYFAFEWLGAISQMRKMTYLERTAAEVEEDRFRRDQPGILSRLQGEFATLGWGNDPTPALFALAFLYLAVAGTLRAVGIGGVVGVAVALPVSLLVIRQVAGFLAVRRRRKFNQQLVQALDILAGQMEAGNGIQRSLEMMVPSMSDPLRGEFETALEATVASKDLVEAIRDIENRYPSRALRLFVSALDIERTSAGQLGRPVREAANLLRNEFELTAEVKAETAQQKLAAIVMVVGIVGICIALIAGLESDAFSTTFGAVALSLATLNFLFGIYRIVNLIRRIEGEL